MCACEYVFECELRCHFFLALDLQRMIYFVFVFLLLLFFARFLQFFLVHQGTKSKLNILRSFFPSLFLSVCVIFFSLLHCYISSYVVCCFFFVCKSHLPTIWLHFKFDFVSVLNELVYSSFFYTVVFRYFTLNDWRWNFINFIIFHSFLDGNGRKERKNHPHCGSFCYKNIRIQTKHSMCCTRQIKVVQCI